MASAPPVAVGFFPLDEELELLPGQLTPRCQEQLARLATWMPFARAAAMFQDFTRVRVNEDYARRHTEKAGAAYVAYQTAEVERLERETPPPPTGPDKLCLSADGAFVPLVGPEWAEVKTLMVGEVAPPVLEKGDPVVHVEAISYFSRLTDHETFGRLALVETHRRGIERARQAAAVLDGAEWLQGFVNFHRPDAVRILDFPHGASYVSGIGQGAYGEGTPETQHWLTTQLHQLKHEGPHDVLVELRGLVQAHPDNATMANALEYLEKREAQLQYPSFQAAGWPIGSGAVESGNKLVVEARLKGSGMHWARPHVDPMLALRNLVCNDRWDEGWPQIACTLRQQAAAARIARHQKRQATRTAVLPPSQLPAVTLVPEPAPVASEPPPTPTAVAVPEDKPRSRTPAANHLWRRTCFGRAQYQPHKPKNDAKL
jgi:hypothetical protein